MVKSVKKKVPAKNKKTCWCGLRMLVSLALAAIGFASLVQGVLLQVKGYGLLYGFLAYLLAFLFVALAKVMHRRSTSCECH